MKGFWREFLINFACIYAVIAGSTLMVYALYRELFAPVYYVVASILFLWYFMSWVIDKKKVLNEHKVIR